jgi:hypothetical protein
VRAGRAGDQRDLAVEPLHIQPIAGIRVKLDPSNRSSVWIDPTSLG